MQRGKTNTGLSVTERLSLPQRQQMIASLLSDPALFCSSRDRIEVELFTQADESGLRLIWDLAKALAGKYGDRCLFANKHQAFQMLVTECSAVCHAQPLIYPLTLVSFVADFLRWVYSQPEGSFQHQYGVQLVQSFLQERFVSDYWHKIHDAVGDGVIRDAASVAKQVAERDYRARAVGDDPVRSGAPDGWVPPAIRKKPTGVRFLDAFLRGGHRAGETYGVLGAFGSGKTTLAIQLAISVAETEQLWAADPTSHPGDQPGIFRDGSLGWPYEFGHVYYFHYEMTEDDIRCKLWSSAASIHLDRICSMGHDGFQLATTANISADDAKILSQAGVDASVLPSEAERIDRAKQLVRTNFWQVDCTSSNDRNPEFGTGYVQEIAAVLHNEVSKGRRVACVIIDYAGACVERHTADKDKIYQCLSQFGRECEHQIAAIFSTPVWIFHQLAGAENKKAASAKQHHANAQGSTRFGENCWFCFNLGTTAEHGCRYFTCSKARRADIGQPPVLKIAGGYNRLIDVSEDYYFDKSGTLRLKNADLSAFATGSTNLFVGDL